MALVLVVLEASNCPACQQQRSVESTHGIYDLLAEVVDGHHP
ncbi:hypothetical protein ACIP95_15825 [Micromonospora parva]